MRSLRCGGSTKRISLKPVSRNHSALTCRPDQEEAPVPPLVELGHHAVDNMGLWGEDVYGIHVSYVLPPVFDALDVCRESGGIAGERSAEGVLVMLRLRMSSSLTTLLMSFWLYSSTMSIFHWAPLAVLGLHGGRLVARRRGWFVGWR